MFVGIVQVELSLDHPGTLKGRRAVVLRVRDRLRQRFEAAVADVGPQDRLHEVVFGIAVVSNDARHARERCDKILAWLEAQPQVEVSDSQTEVLG